MSTPTDVRARRAWIVAHHPDRGGDPDAFVVGLAAFDRAPGGGHRDHRGSSTITFVRTSRSSTTVGRTSDAAARAAGRAQRQARSAWRELRRRRRLSTHHGVVG